MKKKANLYYLYLYYDCGTLMHHLTGNGNSEVSGNRSLTQRRLVDWVQRQDSHCKILMRHFSTRPLSVQGYNAEWAVVFRQQQ